MARKQAAGSTCLFCDRPATSGEHLWPDWMEPVLRRDGHNPRSEIVNNFPLVGAPFGEIARLSSQGATHRKRSAWSAPLATADG
jgi:hypothetical protein